MCAESNVNRYTKKEYLLSMQTLLFLPILSASPLYNMPYVCVEYYVIVVRLYTSKVVTVSSYLFLPLAISCGPAPDAPANGQRSVSGTTFGSTVIYTCDPGYTLQRESIHTCMANKRWSGSAPTCNRKLFTIRCSTLDIHGQQKTASGKTIFIQVNVGRLYICAL